VEIIITTNTFFSVALNTKDSCSGINYVKVKVTKSSNSYSIEVDGKKSNIDLKTCAGKKSVNTSCQDGYQSNFSP
jgi:hypothetical protein